MAKILLSLMLAVVALSAFGFDVYVPPPNVAPSAPQKARAKKSRQPASQAPSPAPEVIASPTPEPSPVDEEDGDDGDEDDKPEVYRIRRAKPSP